MLSQVCKPLLCSYLLLQEFFLDHLSVFWVGEVWGHLHHLALPSLGHSQHSENEEGQRDQHRHCHGNGDPTNGSTARERVCVCVCVCACGIRWKEKIVDSSLPQMVREIKCQGVSLWISLSWCGYKILWRDFWFQQSNFQQDGYIATSFQWVTETSHNCLKTIAWYSSKTIMVAYPLRAAEPATVQLFSEQYMQVKGKPSSTPSTAAWLQ